MINPNVLNAVGEAFDAHRITAQPGEQMPDTVARALHISENEANRWLEALSEGCPVAEANRRAGITSYKENEPLLNAVARLIGATLGSIAAPGSPD